MEEIVKHINNTNASYRNISAGNAKNTDLFLDKEHLSFFDGKTTIKVRLHKDNLSQAILFIASLLPRKFDSSGTHERRNYDVNFVYHSLAVLEGLFVVDGNHVDDIIVEWKVRQGVEKANGEIDDRFYLNGLIYEHNYHDIDGFNKVNKFTIRDYLAGGYSDIHFVKKDDDVFDVYITNTTEYSFYDDFGSFTSVCINNPLQRIYFGAPGTGKSFKINEEVLKGVDKSRIFRTTFHPDTDYASFVGCYKPKMEDKEISYEFVPQVFTDAYIKAWSSDEPVYLVIEEINRGNCAQIFGDLFQLLDRKNGVSEYSIKADKDLFKYLTDKLGADNEGIADGNLKLPANFNILATMNTSDQSLFPMDSAFKRRWEWEYVPINPDHEKAQFHIKIGDKEYLWPGFLKEINTRIKKSTDSEDKQMGEFFIKHNVDEKEFNSKVMFYLWCEICKDNPKAKKDMFMYMKMNDASGKEDKTEFTFDELFGSDSVTILQGFMNYLGIKEIL